MNPVFTIWFGNFFEPFFSSREAVRRGMSEVAALGFTAVNLDSKPWEDFFARYRGEPASPYVAMQEFMMAEAATLGLEQTHLALYLCGDNLYPTIRDTPPVRGEESILPDGSPMGTYKYWSPRARETMVQHVRGLLRLYGERMHKVADGRILMQTMFDPIAKPSFDTEGQEHYLAWLERRYAGDMTRINRSYGLSAATFRDLSPVQYWLRPEALNWVECARPCADDFSKRTPDFWKWIDNQSYLADVVVEYFREMHGHWRELAVFAEPVLHQWGYFFNPPGQAMWQTGLRALDIYRIAPHVDSVLFLAAPINAENAVDAMALSVEASIARTANGERPLTGGLYLGRHVNADIYRRVSPAESIATLVAAGATSLSTYGYSGLDDGGVLFRMHATFKKSLADGIRWAKEVMPGLEHPRDKVVAILFPEETNLYEPLEVDPGGRQRMDLLGWYEQFTALGWPVDIVHPCQVESGILDSYHFLVAPSNSLYDLGAHEVLEKVVQDFVARGGLFFHGPACGLARQAFGIDEENVAFDCISWKEDLIPHGWSTVAFQGISKPLARYMQGQGVAIGESRHGEGRVYSFGFEYGHSYSRQTMPIVPPVYGKREMHPVVLLEKTPVEAIVGVCPDLPCMAQRGLEFARFGDRWVIVNHLPCAIELGNSKGQSMIHTAPTVPGYLAAHSGVFLY